MNDPRTTENQTICSNRALIIYDLLLAMVPTVCTQQSMRINNSQIIIDFTDKYLHGIGIVVLYDGQFNYDIAIYDSNGIIYDSSVGYDDVRKFPSAEALIYEVIRLSFIVN